MLHTMKANKSLVMIPGSREEPRGAGGLPPVLHTSTCSVCVEALTHRTDPTSGTRRDSASPRTTHGSPLTAAFPQQPTANHEQARPKGDGPRTRDGQTKVW